MRFCCAVLLSVLITHSGMAYGQDDRLVVRKDPSDASRLLCDIKYATFTTPKGWQPNRSGGKTYVALTLVGEKFPDLSQMINIDIGKPKEPTSKQLADAFANDWKGEVSEEPLQVDGVEGYRVTIPVNEEKLGPTDCIVIVKDKRAFLLMGGTKTADELAKVMDELVATWKWKP